METLLAILIGTLFGAGVYCLLRRSIVRLAIGVLLLSQGANLLVFQAGGLMQARAPIVPAEAAVLTPPAADPLPQALVLTAIVIGFGTIAFLLALIHRAHQAVGTDDLNAFNRTDRE